MAADKAPVPMWQDLASKDIEVEVRPWALKMKIADVQTEEQMLKMLSDKNYKLYINLHVKDGDSKRRVGLRYLMGGTLDNTDPNKAHVLRTVPAPYKDAAGEDKRNVSGLQTVTAEYAHWIQSLEREIVNQAVAKGYLDVVTANDRKPIINPKYFKIDNDEREEQRAAAEAAGQPVPPPLDAYEYLKKADKFVSAIMPMMADKQEVPDKFVTNVSFKMYDPYVEKAAKEGRVVEPRLTSVYQLDKAGTSMEPISNPETLPRGVPLFCDVNMPTLAFTTSGKWRLSRSFEEIVVAHPDSELGAACAAMYGGGGDAPPAKVGGSSFAAHMPSMTVKSNGGVKRERSDDTDAVAGNEKRAAIGTGDESVAAGTFMVDGGAEDEDYPDDYGM